MRLFIRLVLALIFLFSGIAKILSIDGFELFVFKAIPINWLLVTIFVRLLIALEIIIGLCYLFGIAIQKINKIAFLFISLLSIWLLIQVVKGNSENCQCFGDLFQMDPTQSLIKNALIIGLILILFRLRAAADIISIPKRFTRLWVILVLCFSLLTPFIMSPPDFLVSNRYDVNGVSKNLDFNELDTIPWRGTTTTIEIKKNKHIVLFMSMKCNMCRKAAKKMSIINARYNDTLPVAYIFFGDSVNMKEFWEKSESTPFPYKIISTKLFFSFTRQMPTVFFLNDGKVEKVLGYRNLNDNEVTDFLNLE